jgi:hypothetical protein
MKNRKKRKVFNYKTFDNLLLSTNIFNTLKKFREKKQVSRYFNLDCFDLSTTNQIHSIISNNHFNERSNFKFLDQDYQNLNDSNVLVQIHLNHYINAIILNSFLHNLYYELRNNKVLTETVKNDIWVNVKSFFDLYNPSLKHRLERDFAKTYFIDWKNNFRSLSSFLVKRSRINRILKTIFLKTVSSFQDLLDYLEWDLIDKNKIYQCTITGLFYRFGGVNSFYQDIPTDYLKNCLDKFNISLLNPNITRNYNELFISNSFAVNDSHLYYDSDIDKHISCKYISSKKTIILSCDEKTLNDFPSVNLTSNHNQLRNYSFKVVDGLPFAQMPYENDKNKNFYLGVELEVNKSSRCPRNIIKKLEEEILSGTAICKSDGSLGNNGIELNIVPMTLDYAKQTNYWFKFEQNVKDYLYSYRDKKTGVHIHVPKHLLTRYQIGLIGQFLNLQDNFKYICEIAGRDLENDTSYARANPRHNLKYFINNYPDRYSVLNTNLEKTIEFRMFKGNISGYTMYRYLEFVHALCSYARSYSMNSKTHNKDFITWVKNNKADYPILNQFHLRNKPQTNFRKIETFNVRYKKRFRDISFNVPTLKLAEPLRIRRVRAIRTRANVPSSLLPTTTNQQQQ